VLEHRYGATLLSCLLSGNPVPELGDDATLESVIFRASAISPVDDLVVAGRMPDAGEAMADRTAWRICSGNGWCSAFGKRRCRGKGGKVGPPVHDDLVRREFTATGPNRLWLADIAEHHTGEGKLYCARSRTPGPTGSSATPSTPG
jgi:hypothetical protein